MEEVKPVDLSVIIPCRNEAKRIWGTLAALDSWRQAVNPHYLEVLLTIEPSRDNTTLVATSAAIQFPHLGINVIETHEAKGKGNAVRVGLEHACAEIVMFMDADGSVPMEMIGPLIYPIQTGTADITIGNRKLADSMILEHQPTLRENAGVLFNLIMRAQGFISTKDSQCGFKAFSSSSLKIYNNYLTRFKSDGFGFDVELLYRAKLAGLRIKDVPVAWKNHPSTSVTRKTGAYAFIEPTIWCWRERLSRPI